jgi:hypothetical protein
MIAEGKHTHIVYMPHKYQHQKPQIKEYYSVNYWKVICEDY